MADIFISYLREDWSRAALVARTLEAAGYSVAWDFPGWTDESVIDAIDRERAAARAVLVLWTTASRGSARLHVEALAARRRGCLVQARIGRSRIPPTFRNLPLADLSRWDGSRTAGCWYDLRGLIARALNEPGSPHLLALGAPVWLAPLGARARAAALWTLPLMAVPAAMASAKGIAAYLESTADMTVSQTADATRPAGPLDQAGLIEAMGVCAPAIAANHAAAAQPTEAEAGDGEAVDDIEPDAFERLTSLETSVLTFQAMLDKPAAQYVLGLRLLAGDSQDQAKGLAWLERAGEAGYLQAQMELATLHFEGRVLPRDPIQAVAWFQRAAEAGHVDAQYNLGVLYLSGEGVEQDPVKAGYWLEKAAAAGVAEAAYNVGVIYANGWGLAADGVRARHFLTQAAEAGRPDAQWALGLLLYEGGEDVRDHAGAVKWFQAAAGSGHPNAQYIMSVLHVKGEGVVQSNALGYIWLDLARSNGAGQETLHRELRASLGLELEQETLAAAAQARDCVPKLRMPAPAAEDRDLIS